MGFNQCLLQVDYNFKGIKVGKILYKLEKHFLVLTISHISSTLRTSIRLLESRSQLNTELERLPGAVPVLGLETESHGGEIKWETQNKRAGGTGQVDCKLNNENVQGKNHDFILQFRLLFEIQTQDTQVYFSDL